jgi:hypothetical protein
VSSAAVEHIRGLLVDGVLVEAVRLDDPHLSLVLASGLLPAEYIGPLLPGDPAGRMVVSTPDGFYSTVIPSL